MIQSFIGENKMQCRCFTCSIHRHKEIDKQTRLFAEAVYYATNITNHNYQLRLLKSLGYTVGSLTDEGVEGEMAAIECDCGAYECGLKEIMQELEPHYKKLVERIYKKGGDNEIL